MNEQLKTVETILGIKKDLMQKNEMRDYHVESLNKLNTEIPLLEEELKKILGEIAKETENPFDSAQSVADMLGL